MARAAALAIEACLAVQDINQQPPRVSLELVWAEFKRVHVSLPDLANAKPKGIASDIVEYQIPDLGAVTIQKGPVPRAPQPNTFYSAHPPNDDFDAMLVLTVLYLSGKNVIPRFSPDELFTRLRKRPRALRPMTAAASPASEWDGIAKILYYVLVPATGLAMPDGKPGDPKTPHRGLLLHASQAPGAGSKKSYPPPADLTKLLKVQAHRPHVPSSSSIPVDDDDTSVSGDEEAAVLDEDETIGFDENVLRELDIDDEWGAEWDKF